jgi:Methylamine utilisation protein MauE
MDAAKIGSDYRCEQATARETIDRWPRNSRLIVICLPVPATAWWGVVAAVTLWLTCSGAIAVNIAGGKEPDCDCFGRLNSAPAGWRALARNGVLAGLGAAALAIGPVAAEIGPVPWLARVGLGQLALAAVTAVMVMFALAEGWFLLELVRRHGRSLVRIGGLEARLDVSAPAGSAPPKLERPGSGNGRHHRPGLAINVSAPEFTFSALGSGGVSLADLRTRSASGLLVCSDPSCGLCNAILSQLSEWQEACSERLTLAVISPGRVEQNAAKAEEHGLRDLLLRGDSEVALASEACGTPSAVFVFAGGTIASSVSAGGSAITGLVDHATAASAAEQASAPAPSGATVQTLGLEPGNPSPEPELGRHRRSGKLPRSRARPCAPVLESGPRILPAVIGERADTMTKVSDAGANS